MKLILLMILSDYCHNHHLGEKIHLLIIKTSE